VRSLLLLGLAVLVLLIAVVNVANLMIGQTAAREAEMAMRASLGATPGRLARQLLTEASVLAVAGGLTGTLLAFGESSLLKHLLPAETPRLADVAIDRTALAFSAAISLGSGLLFGLLPAWRVRRQRSLAALEGARSSLSARGVRGDAALVTTEAAFATMLLVGAFLLLHSLWLVLRVDPGFRLDSLVTAELSPGPVAAQSNDKLLTLWDRVDAKLRSYPGVKSVAAMNLLPLTPEFSAYASALEDHPRPPSAPAFVLWGTFVTPEHLETLGLRLLAGREFTAQDRKGSQLVVLVDQATASRFWPHDNPVGKRLKPVWDKEWRTVVGVVDNVKTYSISGPPEFIDGEFYAPLAQPIAPPQTLSVVARLASEPEGFEKRLPAMVQEVCASCAVSKIGLMRDVAAAAVEAPRSTARLVSGLAMLALLLAAAGIYGVVSHGVLRRTRELGVRLALGAGRGRVAALVVASSLRAVAAGAMVGLGCSWGLAHWIRTLLYGIVEHDTVSFALAPVALVAVAVLASLLPVWRAVRIDPARSLREG